jgi:hypothetical protein
MPDEPEQHEDDQSITEHRPTTPMRDQQQRTIDSSGNESPDCLVHTCLHFFVSGKVEQVWTV